MNDHPIESLMITAMNSIENMIEVNTIVGEPINTGNGVTIIPISKVCFGFGAGGTEFNKEALDKYDKNESVENIQYKLPFGGGSGAGVSVSPVAFLVVEKNDVRLMHIDHANTIDKLLDYVPDLMNNISKVINSNIENDNKNNDNNQNNESVKNSPEKKKIKIKIKKMNN